MYLNTTQFLDIIENLNSEEVMERSKNIKMENTHIMHTQHYYTMDSEYS